MSRNTVDFDDLLASLDDLTSTNTVTYDEPVHLHMEEPLTFNKPHHNETRSRSSSSSSSSSSDSEKDKHSHHTHDFEVRQSVDPLDDLLESTLSFGGKSHTPPQHHSPHHSPRHSMVFEETHEEIHLPPPPPPVFSAPPPAPPAHVAPPPPAPSFKAKATVSVSKPAPFVAKSKPAPAPIVAKPKAAAPQKFNSNAAVSTPSKFNSNAPAQTPSRFNSNAPSHTPNKPLHAAVHHDDHDTHHSTARVIHNDDHHSRPSPASNNNNKAGDMRNFARQSTIVTPGSHSHGGGGGGGGAHGHGGSEHCHKCQQRIEGEYMSALGKSFHTNHFTCHDCGNQLGTSFFEHHSNPICQNCAGNLLPCSKCRRGITGQYLIQDGKPHHKECIERWVCAHCNRDIDDVATNALGKHWHKHCFVCRQCNKELMGNFVNQDGQPVCDSCSRKALPKCGTCHQEIVGNYTNFDGKAFHNDCFKCGKCHTKLHLSGFYSVNGQTLCEHCAR